MSLAGDSWSVQSSCRPPGGSYSSADHKTAVSLTPPPVWQRTLRLALAYSFSTPLPLFSWLESGRREPGQRESIQIQPGHPGNKRNKTLKHPTPNRGASKADFLKRIFLLLPMQLFSSVKNKVELLGRSVQSWGSSFFFHLYQFRSSQAHSPPPILWTPHILEEWGWS